MRFVKPELLRQFGKRRLHPVPDYDYNLVNAGSVIESLPSMGYDGSACDFEEKFIYTRPHARALAGRNDDCAVHFAGV